MKKSSTLFLKATIIVIGLGVLALCIFALPAMWKGGSAEFPAASTAILCIITGLYATAIPFFIGLWQALKLLGYIDQNKAFSELSVRALRNIKWCATIIAVLYVGGVPLLYPIAEVDDAPGLLLFGAAIACAPIVVAVFAAVLQKLLENGMKLESENELTI